MTPLCAPWPAPAAPWGGRGWEGPTSTKRRRRNYCFWLISQGPSLTRNRWEKISTASDWNSVRPCFVCTILTKREVGVFWNRYKHYFLNMKKMPQVIFFYKMLYILVYLAPTRALEPHEVREEIYKRECRRLNVIPLRSYLRNPIKNTLAVPYCGLGPRGAMALAAPLMVLFKNLALQNTGMNKRSRSCSEIISLTKVKLFISFRHIKTVLK